MTTTQKLGEYCKHYRVNILGLTRKELAPKTNPQTLAQFEVGNSTNLTHFINYFNAIKEPEIQLEFIKGFTQIIKETNNYD